MVQSTEVLTVGKSTGTSSRMHVLGFNTCNVLPTGTRDAFFTAQKNCVQYLIDPHKVFVQFNLKAT